MCDENNPLFDELDDPAWRKIEPTGVLPVRFCQHPRPVEYWEEHQPHPWWCPTAVSTVVDGNRVSRTMTVEWFRCDGKIPADGGVV